jgi:transcriptional antiterminator NusG
MTDETDTITTPAAPVAEADAPPPAEPAHAAEPPAPAAGHATEPAAPESEPVATDIVPEEAADGVAPPPADTGEQPATPAAEPPAPDSPKKWYVIKVASGREESIKAAIERKVKIEGLEPYFGQIVIPVERVTEVKKVRETKNGEKITKEKRVIKERKKYPGYLMAEVEFNEPILYLFRETNGVGDFVGASGPLKPPPPMTDSEVQRMLGLELSVKDGGTVDPRKTKVKVKIDIEKGDKVRLRDGAFAGTEGEVLEVAEAKDDTDTPKITVEVQFWGRPVKIDNLEYWQVDKV